MADQIDVHFTSNQQKKLRAEVDPNKVKAVLILTTAGISIQAFQTALGITKSNETPPTTLPDGIQVFNGKDPVPNIQGMQGPGVCYWVGNELICW
jgi:hypothetical protein